MKRIVTMAMLLSVMAASAAMADSRHHDDQRYRQTAVVSGHGTPQQDNRRDWRDAHHDRRPPVREQFSGGRHSEPRSWHEERPQHRHDHSDSYRFDYRHDQRYRAGEYRRPWGYREYHWRRGDRLPIAYYGRPYWIDDCPRYGLRYPPRGYHWVRVDHDAVLAAFATGVVLDVIYNSFY